MKNQSYLPLIGFLMVLIFNSNISFGFSLEKSIEEELLNGNWQKVAECIERDTTKATDPVARLIMAHACLALNRNNSSLFLFLSVKEKDDFNAWFEWTGSLLKKQSTKSNSSLPFADAQARTGKLIEAKELLTQALERKQDFALALNARGVIRVLINEWNDAETDLYIATKIAPDFADAQANYGTLHIFREAPEGALEAFNNALKINLEFALAYNGRGCAYFGKGNFEDAIKENMTRLSLILIRY